MGKKFFLWKKPSFLKFLRAVAVAVAVAVAWAYMGFLKFPLGDILGNIPMPAAPTGGVANAEEVAECTEILATNVTKASQGIMDMGGMALVGTASQGAVANSKNDKSAKTAHYGSMAINGAMGVHALSAYDDCTTALTACETACDPETACKTDCKKISIRGLGAADNPKCEPCKAEAEGILAKCEANGAACNQALLQAGLSAVNMGISWMAIRSLGDCEGDDCKKPEEGEEAPLPIPDFQAPSLSFPDTFSPDSSPGGTEEEKETVFTPPPEKETAQAKKEKEKEKGGRYVSNEEDKNTAGLSPSLGGSKSSPSSSNFSGGLGSSGDFGQGLSGSSPGDDSEGGWGEDEEYEDGSNSPGISGTFSGGLASGPSHAGGRGGRGLSSKKNGRSGSKKMAKTSKDKGQKRDIFAKAGAHGSIFEKMSRFIQTHCSREVGNCVVK